MQPNNNNNKNIDVAAARIFVVDDDANITPTFKVGLEQNQFIADIANDPAVALSKFRANKYDLVLIDVKMPKMNGFELYKEIQTMDKNVKVCFITSFVGYYESLREIFLMTDICCFIRKPIEIRVLLT